MGQRIKGSLNAMSAFQITHDVGGLDVACKTILQNKEFLSFILKYTLPEYSDCELLEIMDCIENEVSTSTELSAGRTNTIISGENAEFVAVNEKTSKFDIFFQAKNPKLSTENIEVKLFVDIEAQKNYHPGYPIEKRGIFYLARGVVSQLTPVITENNNYGTISKVYSIWICRDRVPKEERYTLSRYEFVNTENKGAAKPQKENYDLMSLIIIRLGHPEYDDNDKLFRLLNGLFYPEQEGSFGKVAEFIDFEQNKELEKEVSAMSGLGQSILEEGIEQGIEQGILGSVQLLIEVGLTKDQIKEKIMKQYGLNEDTAEEYLKLKMFEASFLK